MLASKPQMTGVDANHFGPTSTGMIHGEANSQIGAGRAKVQRLVAFRVQLCDLPLQMSAVSAPCLYGIGFVDAGRREDGLPQLRLGNVGEVAGKDERGPGGSSGG